MNMSRNHSHRRGALQAKERRSVYCNFGKDIYKHVAESVGFRLLPHNPTLNWPTPANSYTLQYLGRYAVSVVPGIPSADCSSQMVAPTVIESGMPSRTATLAVEDSEKALPKAEVTEGEPTSNGPDYPEGGLQGWATVVGACVVRLWRVSGDLADTLLFQILHPDMWFWVCRDRRWWRLKSLAD